MPGTNGFFDCASGKAGMAQVDLAPTLQPSLRDLCGERSRQEIISASRRCRKLANQNPALKAGFNGRNNQIYSSSCLRF
jgi:hypothetical protein